MKTDISEIPLILQQDFDYQPIHKEILGGFGLKDEHSIEDFFKITKVQAGTSFERKLKALSEITHPILAAMGQGFYNKEVDNAPAELNKFLVTLYLLIRLLRTIDKEWLSKKLTEIFRVAPRSDRSLKQVFEIIAEMEAYAALFSQGQRQGFKIQANKGAGADFTCEFKGQEFDIEVTCCTNYFYILRRRSTYLAEILNAKTRGYPARYILEFDSDFVLHFIEDDIKRLVNLMQSRPAGACTILINGRKVGSMSKGEISWRNVNMDFEHNEVSSLAYYTDLEKKWSNCVQVKPKSLIHSLKNEYRSSLMEKRKKSQAKRRSTKSIILVRGCYFEYLALKKSETFSEEDKHYKDHLNMFRNVSEEIVGGSSTYGGSILLLRHSLFMNPPQISDFMNINYFNLNSGPPISKKWNMKMATNP